MGMIGSCASFARLLGVLFLILSSFSFSFRIRSCCRRFFIQLFVIFIILCDLSVSVIILFLLVRSLSNASILSSASILPVS